jgi:hypothetical protein
LVLGVGTTAYLAAEAGKASATVALTASGTTLAPPLLAAAALTVAITFAVTSGVNTPNSPISPTAIAQPTASSTPGTTTAPIGQASVPGSTTGSAPPATTASSAGGSSAATSRGTTSAATSAASAPTLTPTTPGTFAMSTGGPPANLPITIRNTGSTPAPPTTLTLSLPDDVKVVGPGNNLLDAPLLRLNGAAQKTVGCPAGKGTVTCRADQLAPGESVTFIFRMLAGPKSANGTIIATTGPALPLRIEIPVTITPKK